MLRLELSEIGSYFSVLRVIAAGNRQLAAISSALAVKPTHLSQYLKTLVDLDILVRELPVTEINPELNPEKNRRVRYRIRDNYLRFWFAFVYPNMDLLESGRSQLVMDTMRQGLVTRHTAFVYADVCREKMWELNVQGAWPFYFSQIGSIWASYLDSDLEIDIAALDPEGHNLILGACKYWQEPVDLNILRDLERKAERVTWEKHSRHVWYILFSTGGFTEDLMQLAASRADVLLVHDR